MKLNKQVEHRRLALQAELDAAKTQKERNQLGQFATPTNLALDILSFAKTILPKNERMRFLDPAFGTGSFYSALLETFPDERVEAAVGFEIDPHYGSVAQHLWREAGLNLRLQDFTIALAPSEDRKFNLVICNPPYVRHHHLDRKKKDRLQMKASGASGVPIGGLAGLYCYFLGIAHEWLAQDGIAGWLIPSEFMDVNYGVPIKRYLLTKVELLHVHRFDPDELQFGDALVSSAVVWFRKRRPSPNREIVFSYGGTLSNPSTIKALDAGAVRPNAKWTGFASNGVRRPTYGPTLSDFFSIRRGLATGDNRFFFMTLDQISERRLPMEFFKPILPSPRYLREDIIEAAHDGCPKLEHQLFMLDIRLPEAEIQKKYPNLYGYLETGKSNVAETYLCRHRTPWYAQENRPPPPFLCTYMGRGLEKRTKPFRFIWNKSKATAANVYLLLYPKPFLASALQNQSTLALDIWRYLSSIPATSLLGEGRVYGGGLYKLEPKELGNVPGDAILEMIGASAAIYERQASLFEEDG